MSKAPRLLGGRLTHHPSVARFYSRPVPEISLTRHHSPATGPTTIVTGSFTICKRDVTFVMPAIKSSVTQTHVSLGPGSRPRNARPASAYAARTMRQRKRRWLCRY